jgi:hypothetical protein
MLCNTNIHFLCSVARVGENTTFLENFVVFGQGNLIQRKDEIA